MTVDSSRLRPFVDYLAGLYDSLEEVSEISGIDYQILSDISSNQTQEVEADQAQRVVNFLLAHRRKTADVFFSFDDPDTRPRFPNPALAKMRDDEIKMLKRERKRNGW
jgi:hypothetical protein